MTEWHAELCQEFHGSTNSMLATTALLLMVAATEDEETEMRPTHGQTLLADSPVCPV